MEIDQLVGGLIEGLEGLLIPRLYPLKQFLFVHSGSS